ncbi:uncharacterized protein LOC131927865 [Physella acuta]|uniref:uncharacterized protein LOC131927865 n=1 Tax=Physella acuta TaxID=109671 RepID=UPI0027DDDD6B|nr:uncharacterized protein LOC131927865 [Physella acuta]
MKVFVGVFLFVLMSFAAVCLGRQTRLSLLPLVLQPCTLGGSDCPGGKCEDSSAGPYCILTNPYGTFPPCPDMSGCAKHCPHGYVLNGYGCPTCTCLWSSDIQRL